MVGVREKLSFVRLEDCTDQPGAPEKGHYYTKHFVMKRYGSPETTTTVGAIMLDFEVWYGWDCYQTLSAFIPLGYTVYGS